MNEPKVLPAAPPSTETPKRQPVLRIVDDKNAPAVELSAFKKSKDFQLGDAFLQEHFTNEVVSQHLSPLQRRPNELAADFTARSQRQLLTEVDQRLRDEASFPPDDWVRNILDTNAHIPPRQLSKVIEAKLLTFDVEERARAETTVREMFAGSPQSKVLTEVGELEAYDQAEAPYMSYYGEGKEMAPEAKLDQVAFRLFEDKLSDVVDPTLTILFTNEKRYPGVHALLTDVVTELQNQGDPSSYRNIRRALSEQFRNATSTQNRFLIRETFWAVRGAQYENMKIALGQVQRNVIGAPKGRATLHGNFLNPTAEQMATILSEIDTSKGGLEQLINDYEGFANTETGKTHEREDIRANLDNLVTNPFDLALKWQERIERAVVEPFKPKEPPMITGRRFKEGPGEEEGKPPTTPEPAPEPIPEPTPPPEPSPAPSVPQETGGYYYGDKSLDSLQQWIKRNPGRIQTYTKTVNPDGTATWVDREGKPVERTVAKERVTVEKYLESIQSTSPDYYAYLQSLVEIPTMAPMQDSCRVVVNVPAWMEEKSLYRFLDQYTQQVDKEGNKLNPDLYEINILVNRKTGTPPDRSVEEIEKFIAEKKAQGENYHINFVDVAFDPPFNNVGHARKVITDLTLLRSLRRAGQSAVLYIESEDADMLYIDLKTVANLVDKLDKNPHVDALRGIQDRTPEEMMKNDYMFLERRLGNFIELFLRRRKYRPENNPQANTIWNRTITGGWNTGYTAEAYALIGGYNSYSVMGEDMEIGQKISMVRGDGTLPNLDVIGIAPTRSDSSPRRYMGEIITGRPAYSETFKDIDFNMFIKNAGLEELQDLISFVARINPDNQAKFEKMLNDNLEYFVRSATPSETEAREVFNSAMFWLGFKKEDYEYLENRRVKVKNWGNVQDQLNSYRERHPRARRSGERAGYRLEGEPLPLTEIPNLPFTLESLKESTNVLEQGDYIICLDKPLGDGYYATIVAGYDQNTGELLAFKRVDKGALAYVAENSGFPAGTADTEDIVRAIATNPALLVYRDKFEIEDDAYKVYPLAATDFEQYLRGVKSLAPRTALAATIKIAEGLRELHNNNITHGDIATENILVSKDGQIFLSDFGSVCTGQDGKFARSWGGGSPYFMPPEVFGDNPQLSKNVDTYETCILLYKQLTGKYPYTSGAEPWDDKKKQLLEAHTQGVFEIPESIPDPIKVILRKGINPDPAKRYQTASDLLTDLESAYRQLYGVAPK